MKIRNIIILETTGIMCQVLCMQRTVDLLIKGIVKSDLNN